MGPPHTQGPARARPSTRAAHTAAASSQFFQKEPSTEPGGPGAERDPGNREKAGPIGTAFGKLFSDSHSGSQRTWDTSPVCKSNFYAI